MSYVIYEKESTYLLRVYRSYWRDAEFKTESGAKAFLTRKKKSDPKFDARKYAIAERGNFHKHIEKKVIKRNLMSGKEFECAVNTPASCDPSTETYWSM